MNGTFNSRECMIHVESVSKETIENLFTPCRECVYWEAPHCETTATDTISIKKKWFEETLKTFGNCGKILYVERFPVGYAQYCSPHYLENAREYSKVLPASPDTILISCLYVREGYRKKGLGTALLGSVLDDLELRGYCTVETYSRDDSPNNCSGPSVFYLKNGFAVIRKKEWENIPFSLMRYDFKSR
ncbi:MAG: GNAT family N-acetyltransferase [Theionarchaea archaeon]|nr:GNAT family N-acetyltransferase [Theionarchaea archaeon]